MQSSTPSTMAPQSPSFPTSREPQAPARHRILVSLYQKGVATAKRHFPNDAPDLANEALWEALEYAAGHSIGVEEANRFNSLFFHILRRRILGRIRAQARRRKYESLLALEPEPNPLSSSDFCSFLEGELDLQKFLSGLDPLQQKYLSCRLSGMERIEAALLSGLADEGETESAIVNRSKRFVARMRWRTEAYLKEASEPI